MTQEIKKHKPYPTIIIDDFFDYPDKVIELSNRLEYTDASGNDYRWPGKRSLTSDIYNKENGFFNEVVLRVLGFYLPKATKVEFKADLYFQKISSIYEDGWTHRDNNVLTFIVYLNKNNKVIDAGTSICAPKIPYPEDHYIEINEDKKQESYKDISKLKEYEPYRLKNNNQFKETIRVNNVFNRCVIFNASSYHKANGFNTIDNSEERLTLIGFIYKFTYEY